MFVKATADLAAVKFEFLVWGSCFKKNYSTKKIGKKFKMIRYFLLGNMF